MGNHCDVNAVLEKKYIKKSRYEKQVTRVRIKFATVNSLILCITDPCRSLVCLNNGKCIVNNNGAGECECLPGFKGSTCEKGRVQYTLRSLSLSTRIFLNQNSEISRSSYSVLKSNSLVHTNLMISGFTLEKLGFTLRRYIGLSFGKRLDFFML